MSGTTATRWIDQRSTHATKRKRAGLVCIVCHERKIKCDLQAQDEAGQTRCSRCIATKQECRLRASKRGLHHSHRAGGRNSNRTHHVQVQLPSPLHDASQSQSQVPSVDAEIESALCTPPRDTNEAISGLFAQPPQPPLTAPVVQTHHSVTSPPFAPNPTHYMYPQLVINHVEPTIAAQSQSAIETWAESSPQSSRNKNSDVFLGEGGFLTVYSQEHRDYTNGQETGGTRELGVSELPGPDMMQIFTETYFNSCYAFCPVLDRETLSADLARSPLLVNSLALTGSQIQPPIIPSTKPATYYRRAKHIFFNDEETDPITCLQAIALFYWWSPRPTSKMQRDGAWWWSAVAIRQAQQLGFNREIRAGPSDSSEIDRGLRRRIWWTFFARERLTAICQSRPCMIDPDDCNIPPPTLDDFPDPTDIKAEIFVQWIRLCSIIGEIAKYRSRVTDIASLAFPVHLAEDLIKWVQSLPPALKLPIDSNVISTFDRDVHQLHLPYLAVIIILHLSPSSEQLPRAYVAAVMAASCVARIFKDYLSRGGIRFLMPVISRLSRLTRYAEEDIKVLVTALTELRVSFPVADMFLQGFERLRTSELESAAAGANNEDDDFYNNANDPMVSISNGIDWVRYFPYMTDQTSGLAGVLLLEHHNAPFLDEAWMASTPFQLQELFGPFAGFPDFVSIT